MTNKNRYEEEINGKKYESTLNVMGPPVVRPYASFAPEFGKGVHVVDKKETCVGDLGQDVANDVSIEQSMEK